MGGYGTIGLVLLFAVLLLVAYILLHTHSIKVVLDDKELKRAAMIVRLRNIAITLGLLAISFYFLIVSGMQTLYPGSTAHVAREATATGMLFTGLALLATATYLVIIGRQPEFNFKRSLQQYAVREKIRASFKLRQKSKSKRSTRV